MVGHQAWYAGVALVVATLAATMRGRPRAGALGHVLALGVGLTWASNVLGASGTFVPGLFLALVATAYGWRERHNLGLTLLTAGAAADVVLLGHLLTSA